MAQFKGKCPRCEEQTEPVRIDDTLTRMECGNPECAPPAWGSQVLAWLPVGLLVGLVVAIAVLYLIAIGVYALTTGVVG